MIALIGANIFLYTQINALRVDMDKMQTAMIAEEEVLDENKPAQELLDLDGMDDSDDDAMISEDGKKLLGMK